MNFNNHHPHAESNARIWLGFASIAVLFCIVAARYTYLQIFQFEHFTTASDKNRIRLQAIPPTRGYIYDRNGILLADNQAIFSAVLDREHLNLKSTYVQQLQHILNITPEDIKKIDTDIKNKGSEIKTIVLKSNLEPTQLARFAEVRYLFPGVSIETKMTRFYPHYDLFAHVIGYVGRINDRDAKKIDKARYAGTELIGKSGIEKQYESILLGQPGFLSFEADAHSNVIRKLNSHAPVRGNDIYLSIDIGLQQVAMQHMKGRRGAVVALDPKNGDVLAFVSSPSFNPNLFINGISSSDYKALNENIDQPLYNRAVQGVYPPGSTIKPFAGLGGLHYGLVDWNYKISDPGFFSLPGDSHRFRDWKKTGHGVVNLDKAIAISCDTYFYQLIHRMGIDPYHDWMAQFGFGSKTGIDLPFEKAGILPSTQWKFKARGKKWFEGESMSVGIGQGYFTATPLQIALATAITANKGQHLIPHLLKRSRGPAAVQIITQPDKPIKFNGKPEDWDLMHQAMVHVITQGTAGNLRRGLEGYQIAGKTGTAQVVGIAQGKRYNESALKERHHDHAWFMGFAPASDPKVAVAVIIENGKHGNTGAGPVAKAVFDYVVHTMSKEGYKPNPASLINNNNAAPTPVTDGGDENDE